MKKIQDIVVVMPAYNAEKTIENVFHRIPEEALKQISTFIVVDDGSKDKTYFKIADLKQKFRIEYIFHEKNRGYGAAQKTGFNAALKRRDMRSVVLLHSDGQYAPEMLLDINQPIYAGQADIVGGSRLLGGNTIQGGMPWIRYAGNIILTALENFVFKANIKSYHSGYKAYSRKALELIPFNNYTNKFHFDSEMLVGAIRNKLTVIDIPIPTHYGDEESYLDPLTYGLGVLGVIMKYLRGQI